jgi:hypothetical protein
MLGQCKLCFCNDVELRYSHFVPAGAMKRTLDKTAKNPAPYRISTRSISRTSKPQQAYLLCHDCEQRFEQRGENWIFKHCYQLDTRFPLQDILSSRKPELGSASKIEVHYAANIPEMNISAIAYFAASMFWRGSIYGWNDDKSVPVRLGPFQEPLRKYLLDEGPFPQECVIWVALKTGRGVYERSVYPPYGERKDGFHGFKFPMAGIAFAMLVSKHLPETFRRMCIVHGEGNPIMRTTEFDNWLEQDAIQKIIRNPLLLDAIRRMDRTQQSPIGS